VKNHAVQSAGNTDHSRSSGLPLFLQADNSQHLSERHSEREPKLSAYQLIPVVQQRTAEGTGQQTLVFRQPGEQYQSVPPEVQPEQCTDPCAVVDKEAFAGYLMDAKNLLETTGVSFGGVVGWTKINKQMAAALKGKEPQTYADIKKLNRSIRYTEPPEYNIPYCFRNLKGEARSKWKPHCDFEQNEVKLVQIAGTPAEAVEEIFQNLENWHLDCAQYLQVARWYALLRTLGPACFNARIKQLNPVKLTGEPALLELKPHGSSGIVGQKLYKRASPHDANFYLEDKIAGQTTSTAETEFSLLEKAPIGSRVAWINLAAPRGSSFRHENTYKLGDDFYMSHPFGSGNQQYIECQLAARTLPRELMKKATFSWLPRSTVEEALQNMLIEECRRGEMRPEMHLHILDNIYIGWIEFFEF
jgi:hypothetical protein